MKNNFIIVVMLIVMNIPSYSATTDYRLVSKSKIDIELKLKNELILKGNNIIAFIKNNNSSGLLNEISPQILYDKNKVLSDMKYYNNVFKTSTHKFHDLYHHQITGNRTNTLFYSSNSDDICLKLNFLTDEKANLIYKVTHISNNSCLFIITLGKYKNEWKLERLNLNLYTVNKMKQQDIYSLGKQFVESKEIFTGITYLSTMLNIFVSNETFIYAHNREDFNQAERLLNILLRDKYMKKFISKFDIFQINGVVLDNHITLLIDYVNPKLQLTRESNIEDCKAIVKEILKQDTCFAKHFGKVFFRIFKKTPIENEESLYYGLDIDINKIKEKN